MNPNNNLIFLKLEIQKFSGLTQEPRTSFVPFKTIIFYVASSINSIYRVDLQGLATAFSLLLIGR